MCNGLPISIPEGEAFYEAKDADAAEAIAELVAAKADIQVCPRIRECFAQCLMINNRHRHSYPDVPACENADGVDGRECDVFLNCPDPYFAFETVSIPYGLLKEDR